MALHILPPRQTFGSAFGTGLGQGLSAGIQGLMQSQAQAAERDRQAKAFGVLPGLNLNPGEASALANLPGPLQQAFVKQTLQAPGQQAFNKSLEALVSGGPAQPQEALAENQLQQPNAQPNPQQAFKIPPGMPQQHAMQLAQLALQQQQRKEALGEKRQILAQQKQQKEEALKEKHQAQIEKINAPYLKNLDSAVSTAQKINHIATQMKALVDTGKVATRMKGKFIPRWAQNPETQDFEALSNELAILKSKEETGGALRAVGMVKLMQTAKPALDQDRRTQMSRIEDLLKTSSEGMLKGEVKNYIISKHGLQPANIGTEIDKMMKGIPEITGDVEEGDVWQDTDSGQYYKIQNGLQIPIMPPGGTR